MATSPGKKGGRQSTLAFRLINPELFIKPVSIISLSSRFFAFYFCCGWRSMIDQPAIKLLKLGVSVQFQDTSLSLFISFYETFFEFD